MEARRLAAFAVTRARRLERVYTLTLYGGAPPRRFRCERGVIRKRKTADYSQHGFSEAQT